MVRVVFRIFCDTNKVGFVDSVYNVLTVAVDWRRSQQITDCLFNLFKLNFPEIPTLIQEFDARLANRPVFSGRELAFTFAICYRPSVCRLSVMLVHPTQAVEILGNFFSPYDSSGTLVF